jgi:hypothetical protein
MELKDQVECWNSSGIGPQKFTTCKTKFIFGSFISTNTHVTYNERFISRIRLAGCGFLKIKMWMIPYFNFKNIFKKNAE